METNIQLHSPASIFQDKSLSTVQEIVWALKPVSIWWLREKYLLLLVNEPQLANTSPSY